jgi:hypothetical protein
VDPATKGTYLPLHQYLGLITFVLSAFQVGAAVLLRLVLLPLFLLALLLLMVLLLLFAHQPSVSKDSLVVSPEQKGLSGKRKAKSGGVFGRRTLKNTHHRCYIFLSLSLVFLSLPTRSISNPR